MLNYFKNKATHLLVKNKNTANSYLPPLKINHTYALEAVVLVMLLILEKLLSPLSLVFLDFLLSVISVRAKDTTLLFVGMTV